MPALAALPFMVLLIGSGRWASRRFAQFGELPGHFGFDGKPTRMAARRTMVWLLPVLFTLTLAFVAVAGIVLPRTMQNGDPVTGTLVAGFGLACAQGLVLWLTERWARKQS